MRRWRRGERMANPPADAIPGAITHDLQTEGHYIVSGAGTAFIDGKVVNGRKSTANSRWRSEWPGLRWPGRRLAQGRTEGWRCADCAARCHSRLGRHSRSRDYLSFRPSHGVMKNGWANPTIAK